MEGPRAAHGCLSAADMSFSSWAGHARITCGASGRSSTCTTTHTQQQGSCKPQIAVWHHDPCFCRCTADPACSPCQLGAAERSRRQCVLSLPLSCKYKSCLALLYYTPERMQLTQDPMHCPGCMLCMHALEMDLLEIHIEEIDIPLLLLYRQIATRCIRDV